MKPLYTSILLSACLAFVACDTDEVSPTGNGLRSVERKLASRFEIQASTSQLRLAVDLFTEGTITVAWGDGSRETIYVTGGETSFWFEREHRYAKFESHKITLVGDLDKIVGITVESMDIDSRRP